MGLKTTVLARLLSLGCVSALLLGGTAALAQGDHWQQRIQQGQKALAQGQYTQALNALDQAIAQNPNAAEAYLKRAEVYAQMGNHGAALQNFNAATTLNPRDASAWLQRYGYFMKKNMPAQAEYDLTEGLRLMPYNPELNYAYALHLFNKGDKTHALSTLRTLQQVQPMPTATQAVAPVFIRGSALRAQLYAEARAFEPYGQELNYLIATQPRAAKLYWNRALWHKNYARDLASAKTDLNSYLYLQPKDGRAYALRAEINLVGNLCKDALADLKMACKLGQQAACYKKAPCKLPVAAPAPSAAPGSSAGTVAKPAGGSQS